MKQIRIQNGVRYTETMNEHDGAFTRWFWHLYASSARTGHGIHEQLGYTLTRRGAERKLGRAARRALQIHRTNIGEG